MVIKKNNNRKEKLINFSFLIKQKFEYLEIYFFTGSNFGLLNKKEDEKEEIYQLGDIRGSLYRFLFLSRSDSFTEKLSKKVE